MATISRTNKVDILPVAKARGFHPKPFAAHATGHTDPIAKARGLSSTRRF